MSKASNAPSRAVTVSDQEKMTNLLLDRRRLHKNRKHHLECFKNCLGNGIVSSSCIDVKLATNCDRCRTCIDPTVETKGRKGTRSPTQLLL
jgi:hypothetical protein